MEKIRWRVRWTCEKYKSESDRLAGLPPYETLTAEENILLAAGITELFNVLTGLGGTTFSSGNAYVYVGDSTTAVSSGQTDLQGTNKADAAMDSTYPQVSNQTAIWSGTFGGSVANFTWNEVGVKNGLGAPGGPVVLLNRRLVSFGTKPNGTSWSLRCSVSLS